MQTCDSVDMILGHIAQRRLCKRAIPAMSVQLLQLLGLSILERH